MSTANFTTLAARWLAPLLAAGALVGCSSGSDLDQFITQTNAEAGDKVQPLREFHPYEPYAYAGSDKRSPFVPGSSGSGGGPRPESSRNREFLEQFSLDTLRMVGTLSKNGQHYGLVQVKDGRVQRVSVGNFIGQNDGRVTAIDNDRIQVTETVADGLGGYIERPATIALSD